MMTQVEVGHVLMTFTLENGEWDVIWHSNIADYSRVKSVIEKHDTPQPIIDELRAKGLIVEVIWGPGVKH